MKILEINKFYYPHGGADRHFLDLVNLLSRNGHQVAVFSMQHERNQTSIKWSKYFVSKVGYESDSSLFEKIKGVFRMFYSFEANRKLNQLLDEFMPDIVHVHNIYHQLPPSILFQIKKRKIPIVMTVHDFKMINPNYNLYLDGKHYDRCQNGKFYQCFLDRAVKNSYAKSFLAMLEAYWHQLLGSYGNIDLFIAPSSFAKNKLIHYGIDSSKIAVLPHFINGKLFENLPPCDKRPSNPGIYAGYISEGKGIKELISLCKNIPELRLKIAGNLAPGVSEKDFPSNMNFIGRLTRVQLAKEMNCSKFVISCSKLPETFGLIAMEAIALGVPFVGLQTGAFSEIIDSGKNGFLVNNQQEMGSAIKKIISGETFLNRDDISKNAQEKYSEKKYLHSLIAIFQELITANQFQDHV